MPDQALDLINAAERIDHRSKPETCELAARVQTLVNSKGYSVAGAALKVARALSTTERLAKIDLDSPIVSMRRAIIALMILAGPRASEVCELRWRDVDLVNRRLTVRGTKTAAATREVRIVDFLARELERWMADSPCSDPEALLFPTATGRKRTHGNLRQRVITPALAEANRFREQRKLTALPKNLTPHSCRRSFAALMLADNRPVPMVQYEIGHADARTTLNIYTQVVNTDFEPTLEMLHELCCYEPEKVESRSRRLREQPRTAHGRAAAAQTGAIATVTEAATPRRKQRPGELPSVQRQRRGERR
jgi:integrase